MDIKTDWTPDDYYNIHDDLTRTEGNIHEIAAVLSAAGARHLWTKNCIGLCRTFRRRRK